MLNCIDNSGAAMVECVAVMRKKKQAARIGLGQRRNSEESVSDGTALGDRIIVVVQKQRSFGAESPGSSSLGITNKVRRGDIRHAVVVRAKKEIQRKDGGLIRFDDNACVLINKTGDPIGTRLTSMPIHTKVLSASAHMSTGVVGAELRDKQWSKILSLAPLHV
jgi:ribosomal protein L14